MAREKRIYELWERTPHPITWRALWTRHRFAVLLGIAIALSIVLGEMVNQPWFHLLEVLVIIDLIAFRHPVRWGGHQAVVFLLLHGFAVVILCLHVAQIASVATGVYSLFLILLILFPRKE